MSEPNMRERAGLRKIGNPPGFQFYSWEFVQPDSTIMVGCVVTRNYKRGPNKGRPVYDGTPVKVIVSEMDVADEGRIYEAETGKCSECVGTGKCVSGWDHVTGTSYRTCRKCYGKGEPIRGDSY